MNDHRSGRSQGDYEQFRAFQQEAQTRSAAISTLRPSELEAIQRIGRLFTEFRISRDLDHQAVSERSGVTIEVLRLLEQSFLMPAELSSELLAEVGSAFSSSVDRLVDDKGGVFASIAGSMLEAGRWAGSEAANPEVDALIASLGPSNENSVREESAWRLGDHVLNPRVREALTDVVVKDRFSDVRLAALESLAAVPEDPAVREVLLGTLADLDPAVRTRAAEIVGDSILENQSGMARTLSRLMETTEQISESILDRFRNALALVPSLSMKIQIQPRVEGAASQSLIGVDIESEHYNADLIMNGEYPEFGLVLGITFVDAQAWAGHIVRVQLASNVENELTSAGWRVEWMGFGPDVVDSETPISAFGRVEMLLGRTSLSGSGGTSTYHHNLLEALVTVIARALSHEDAISRLDSVDQG